MIGVAVFSFEILRPNSPTISVPDQTGDQFFFFSIRFLSQKKDDDLFNKEEENKGRMNV